jgi:serine/threonine protein kinase
VIADFGLARVQSTSLTLGTLGTQGFIAPEIILETPYSEKADVYSFSMVGRLHN